MRGRQETGSLSPSWQGCQAGAPSPPHPQPTCRRPILPRPALGKGPGTPSLDVGGPRPGQGSSGAPSHHHMVPSPVPSGALGGARVPCARSEEPSWVGAREEASRAARLRSPEASPTPAPPQPPDLLGRGGAGRGALPPRGSPRVGRCPRGFRLRPRCGLTATATPTPRPLPPPLQPAASRIPPAPPRRGRRGRARGRGGGGARGKRAEGLEAAPACSGLGLTPQL